MSAKPSETLDSSRVQWSYVVRRAVNEFRRDRCLDQSASLAFRSALTVFPVLLMLVSLLGLLGETSRVMRFAVDTASTLGSAETSAAVRALFEALAKAPAGYAFALGLGLTLWSASGYVTAFGRALNSIYGVPEGRVAWKLRVSMVPLAILLVCLVIVGLAMVAFGGSLADAAMKELGFDPVVRIVWDSVRFPIVVILAMLVIALLYYFSPNVKHPKLRWLSLGAGIALSVWAVASAGFFLYFANFSSFDRSYGAIGGALVFLLWLWLTNWALLLGGEFDAELERMRQLRAGRDASNQLHSELRSSKAAIAAALGHAEDVREAAMLKEAALQEATPRADRD